MIIPVVAIITTLILAIVTYVKHKNRRVEVIIDLEHNIVRASPRGTFVTVDVDNQGLVKVEIFK